MKISIIALGVLLITNSTLHASLIIAPLTPTSNVAANAGSSLANLVNGDSGSLSNPLPTGASSALALSTTHALDDVSGSYVTAAKGTGAQNYFDEGGTPPVLTFTLDQAYDRIDSVILWNYSHDNESNQASDFTITFFTDIAASSQVGSAYMGTLAERPGGATFVAPEQFIFGTNYDGVRSFKLELTDNHYGNRVGLGELRLTTAVPEPSSAALLFGLLGGLCFLRQKRRVDA